MGNTCVRHLAAPRPPYTRDCVSQSRSSVGVKLCSQSSWLLVGEGSRPLGNRSEVGEISTQPDISPTSDRFPSGRDPSPTSNQLLCEHSFIAVLAMQAAMQAG